MKVLVFGGAGFLGSYVVDALVDFGYKVTVYDIKKSLYSNNSVDYIIGDILDNDSVCEAVKGCDIVYNFAGLADLNESIDNPGKTINLNIIGNLNILKACVTNNISRFVYASSAYVFSQKGGFLMLYVESEKQQNVINSLNNLFYLQVGLDSSGTRVTYYDQTY